MKSVRLVKKRTPAVQGGLEPKLVLPQENSDNHPLMQKYASISKTALKDSPADLEADPGDEPLERVG